MSEKCLFHRDPLFKILTISYWALFFLCLFLFGFSACAKYQIQGVETEALCPQNRRGPGSGSAAFPLSQQCASFLA